MPGEMLRRPLRRKLKMIRNDFYKCRFYLFKFTLNKSNMLSIRLQNHGFSLILRRFKKSKSYQKIKNYDH